MRAIYHHRTQGRDVEAVHIRGLATGLEELGCEVEVVGPPGVDVDSNSAVAPTTGRSATLLGVLARRLPQAAFECLEVGYNLVAFPRLLRQCRRTKPTLIYERYALYNAAGVLAGRLAGVPVVLEVNETVGVDRTRQGKKLALPGLARWVESRILRSASGVTVVSGYLRDYVRDAGVSEERIQVTPNAINSAQFDPERVDGRSVRARYGLEGKTVIGFAGSFAKWHGLDLLLSAASDLMAEFPDVYLLLVGDGARRQETEALAAQLGISHRVVFTGKAPHAEIPQLIAAMDVGVMPASNVYGSPMKVFEYMAMGCPPVAPQVGPLEEAITDGETGLLFKSGSSTSLYTRLRKLVLHPELRKTMGAAARRQVLSHHLWRHNAQTAITLAHTVRKAPSWPRSILQRKRAASSPEAPIAAATLVRSGADEALVAIRARD